MSKESELVAGAMAAIHEGAKTGMRNCTTCKWDIISPDNAIKKGRTTICEQGHYRCGSEESRPINNCHAHQEKEKCECHQYDHSVNFFRYNLFIIASIFQIICKKCGRVIE